MKVIKNTANKTPKKRDRYFYWTVMVMFKGGNFAFKSGFFVDPEFPTMAQLRDIITLDSIKEKTKYEAITILSISELKKGDIEIWMDELNLKLGDGKEI